MPRLPPCGCRLVVVGGKAGGELGGNARLTGWEKQGLTLQLLFSILLAPCVHSPAENKSLKRL